MKDTYGQISLVKLCRLLGVSRQSYYQHLQRFEMRSMESQLILQEVRAIRKKHRRMGGRKLYEKLEPFMLDHQIKMGRDALFNLLSANNMLVKKQRKRVYTTNSFHWLRKYPNLLENMELTRNNQLWVSDITYWKANEKYYYISLITDSYSKKIVGYHVAETLEAIETLKALKMAIQGLTTEPDSHFELTHHSDRGIQYCSKEYVKLLKDNNIKISMTENGDPRENAVAERVNGIIKNEYLFDHEVKNVHQGYELLSKAIQLYNQERPHLSLGMLTPNHVHEQKIKPEKLWKNYYKQNHIDVNPYQDEKLNVNLS